MERGPAGQLLFLALHTVPGPICYSDPQVHRLLPARFHLVQCSLLTFLKVSTTWGCSNARELPRGMPWSMCTGGRKHTPTPLRQLSANHRAVSATVLLLSFQYPSLRGTCPSTTMNTHAHAHTQTHTHSCLGHMCEHMYTPTYTHIHGHTYTYSIPVYV